MQNLKCKSNATSFRSLQRDCDFSSQNGQSCQEICNCTNFKLSYDKFTLTPSYAP